MNKIIEHIEHQAKGKILFVSDFLDIIDNEKAISRILSTEEKRGNLTRLANGIYVRHENTRFGKVIPPIEKIVEAIAIRDNVKILPCGATALNILGLSTQVPTKYCFITSGSGRSITINGDKVEFLRSVPKNFAYKTKIVALLVQALKTIGEESISPDDINIINSLIKQEPCKEDMRQDILHTPIWMRKILTPLAI